jgi:hypothetical protein
MLHDKAVSSMTVATKAFNDPSDLGRVTQVLLSLQHAFEMLLKSALVQKRRQGLRQEVGPIDPLLCLRGPGGGALGS